ncbi:ATP-dependent exoDNAse (exonuclease V) alpha subunit [Bradyrhizobium sp. GM0.4]
MTTLRPLTEDGFGPKRVAVVGEDGQPLRMKSGKIAYRLWAGEKQEFLEQRNGSLDLQNQHLALHGHEIRVDGRSYAERGIDVVPTTHIGVAAKAIQRRAEREGLEKEAGIQSRTLASWELRWKRGRNGLNDRTVFVLDEAGMVASRQMALFIETASKAGAKIVLVGDPEQLQPIEAGAAFRAIVERIGYAELETIYRQGQQWMRDRLTRSCPWPDGAGPIRLSRSWTSVRLGVEGAGDRQSDR